MSPQGLKVIHQTGVADEEMVRSRYAEAGIEAQVAAFFTDMAEMYEQADLLISRAGATTLAEAGRSRETGDPDPVSVCCG